MSAERIAVVTGASSGIGLEAARLLAAQGWRVLGVGRDPARCREAREALRESTGSTRVDFETADLSSQEEIRSLARRIAGRLTGWTRFSTTRALFFFPARRHVTASSCSSPSIISPASS
ncbi:MAG TPA: SDR family NAD(P)-dependent oxidoreductase [Spirochaetia bacterium]|nr:SDR family NAD(P)-dependent oxidoreductase [Spirochaetia bacterium]